MRDVFRSAICVFSVAAGLALACTAQGQAYRVRVLESGPSEQAWATAITDAGDVVGRVGDSYAIWQVGPGFGRAGGLTLLAEIDGGTGGTGSPNGGSGGDGNGGNDGTP